MVEIVTLFHCLQPHVTATTVRQFSRIAGAMLVMTGRVTMLGISRWAGKGGSYRTVQRFFAQIEEHTSELQSRSDLVCRLLLEKKKETLRSRTYAISKESHANTR